MSSGESEPSRAPRHHSAATWRAASVILSWCSFALALVMAGWGGAWGAPVVWGPLAGIGLYLATVIRLSIIDMVAEFSYRERFGAFLLHVVVLVSPALFLNLSGAAHALGALGALIALHAATPSQFGRLLACSGALVIAAYAKLEQPPAGLAPVWALLALLTVRTLHVRFTLEAEGDAHGPDARFEIRQLLPSVGMPMLASLMIFAVSAIFMEPRALSFRPGEVQSPTRPIGPVSSASVFFDAAMVIVLIIVLLVLLNYLQSLLRNLKQASADEAVLSAARATVVTDASAAEEGMAEAPSHGARDRILKAFRRLARGLATTVPRAGHETSAEYAGKVARLSERQELAATQSGTFDLACYAQDDVPDAAAAEYESYVTSELELVRSRVPPKESTPNRSKG